MSARPAAARRRYENTERRQALMAAKGIHHIGMGVSGGEEGARNGGCWAAVDGRGLCCSKAAMDSADGVSLCALRLPSWLLPLLPAAPQAPP